MSTATAGTTARPGAGAKKTGKAPAKTVTLGGLFVYILLGILFGIALTKSEVISWFRIQEMFRFQAFHMYGVIGSAVVVAAVALQIIKRTGARTVDGDAIEVPPKEMGRGVRYWLGGSLFGLGWGLVGACPGPLFALLGNGIGIIIVPLVSAMLGTYVYGMLRGRLAH